MFDKFFWKSFGFVGKLLYNYVDMRNVIRRIIILMGDLLFWWGDLLFFWVNNKVMYLRS